MMSSEVKLFLGKQIKLFPANDTLGEEFLKLFLEGELLLDEKVFTIDGNCVLTRIM